MAHVFWKCVLSWFISVARPSAKQEITNLAVPLDIHLMSRYESHNYTWVLQVTKAGLKFTMVSFEGDFPAFGMQISQQIVERSLGTRLVLEGPGYIRIKNPKNKH